MAAPLPSNEAERLRRLHRFGILGTPPDPRFDRIARLASRLLDCPMALVSLVDDGRQWFKANVGVPASETPREHAFCAHAILEGDVLVVGDATEDRRFADNPLVQGEPHIRFYAGAPLMVGEGLAVGTLCVLDRQPRELDEAGRRCLADLADLVVDALDHHLRVRMLEEAHIEISGTHEELEAISFAIGHDMRAPLRQMGALLELFESDHREDLNETAIAELDTLRHIRRRADEALRGMMELVRVPRSGPLRVGSVELGPVLRELDATMGGLYPAGKLRFEPPTRPLLANAALLRRMLHHVVDNGFRHGGKNVRIEVSVGSDWDRIAVLDDGPGVPAEFSDIVFEPFRRLAPKSTSGSGVGLTVVAKIARLHGGRVKLDPHRIGGTAVVIELPSHH